MSSKSWSSKRPGHYLCTLLPSMLCVSSTKRSTLQGWGALKGHGEDERACRRRPKVSTKRHHSSDQNAKTSTKKTTRLCRPFASCPCKRQAYNSSKKCRPYALLSICQVRAESPQCLEGRTKSQLSSTPNTPKKCHFRPRSARFCQHLFVLSLQSTGLPS